MQCVFQGWLWYNATNEVLADEFLECPNKYMIYDLETSPAVADRGA